MASLFAPTAPIPEISAAQARAIIREVAPKSRARNSAVATPVPVTATPIPVVPVTSRPVPHTETLMPSTPPALNKPTRNTRKKETAPVTLPALANVAPQIEVAPVVVALTTPEVEKATSKKSASEPKKSKRPRVPVNLAEQYGQSLSKRVENGVENTPVETDSPKKRLSRAERAARRELMNPDEDLMARLQRAHSIIPTVKAEKRPRGWRFDCGRCGQTSYFQTGGAICGCGALAIKD